MKLLLKYSTFFILLILLSTCKKYDEGGLLVLRRKHLFGERKDGASKTWKLEKYEVNGIDSTYLIPGANLIPNFYENFITFTLDNKEGYSFKAKSYIFEYSGFLGYSSSKNIIIVGNKEILSSLDSSQCGYYNSILYCLRNVFIPEYYGPGGSQSWDILKLKKKEFILANNKLTNKYKVILTYNK
jgi:hypothetical protein